MANIPMLPSAAVVAQPPGLFTCGGFQPTSQRQYQAVAGTIVSVPIADDVTQLQNRGWFVLPGSGTTAQRPTSLGGGPLTPGTMFLDSTIGKTIIFDGAAWRDTQTGGVV